MGKSVKSEAGMEKNKTGESSGRSQLDKALALAASDPDMPSLGQAAARLAGVDEDRQSIESLCEIALSDPGLAQKIIRSANSAKMGQSAGGRPWSLARALSALGMEQVRAMAMALSLVGVGKARGMDLGRSRKIIATSLAACFSARELARATGCDKDAWGLRALFMGCLPFLIDMNAPELGERIRMGHARLDQWPEGLAQNCHIGQEALLEKIMLAWKFPPDACKTPEGPKHLAESAVAGARALSLENEASRSLEAALAKWDEQSRSKARLGLAKGVATASLCGLEAGGRLSRIGLDLLAKGSSFEQIVAAWARVEDLKCQAVQASCARPALAVEHLADPYRSRALSEQWGKALADISQQAMDGALRSDVALQGLEALATALSMERAMCAFGSSAEQAKVCASLGPRVWAREFAKQRSLGRADAFAHSLDAGLPWKMADSKAKGFTAPQEAAPVGSGEVGCWLFMPLGPKGNPKGYAFFSGSKAMGADADVVGADDLGRFASQWALSLMLSKE